MAEILLDEENIDVFLGEYFQYYRTLNNDWKKVFVGRVLRFVDSKSFVGKEGFVRYSVDIIFVYLNYYYFSMNIKL